MQSSRSVSRLHLLALSAILTLLAGAISLRAQATSASLHGIVTDPSGGAVPNVVVDLSDEHGQVRETRTDGQGRYNFGGIASGTYDVRASATGFAPSENRQYRIEAGSSGTLDFALALKVNTEQVTVTESAAQVDTDPANNAGALRLQQADLDALPDDPDDLTNDLTALAGPAAGPNGAQFFIDGFTGGRLPPKQSIREIRINDNPFAAEFDRPGQGRIQIFTKPGSDAFHGTAMFQFSNSALISRNPFVTVKPPYERKQWEGQTGGPLGKKTSFTANFVRRDINEDAFVNATILDSNLKIIPFAESVVTPLANTQFNIKVDRQMNAAHTLSVRYIYAHDANDNQGVGGFSLSGRAYNLRDSENAIQLIETGVLNPHTVNETRFRFDRLTTNQGGGAAAPTITVLDAFSSGGSPFGASFDNQNRYELQNVTSYVSGRNTFRFGGLVRGVTLTDQAMQNYAGTFTFTSLASYQKTLLGRQQGLSPAQIQMAGGGPSQFSLTTGNPLASLNQFDFGVFAQDDWRVRPTVTLSAGLRYEAQTHANDWADLGPRLALAWAFGNKGHGSPKNVIRVGSGIFYDRLSETLTLDALHQNGIRQQLFLIPSPNFFPAVPPASTLMAGAQPQTIRGTDAHWRAPQMIQGSVGYERQLPNHVMLATTYIHTTGTHALRSRNINAPLPDTGVRPYGGVNSIYLYETSGVFRQEQWITNLTARVNSNFMVTAFYVYGFAMSNTDSATTFPANQYDLSSEYGRAAFDIRHRFQMEGSVATRWGLRFNPFLTIASGRPFNITTGQQLYGDGLFTARPSFATNPSRPGLIVTPYGLLDPAPVAGEVIIPRNFGNGPGIIAANIRVSKSFDLPHRSAKKDSSQQISLALNARNFLNHPNLAAPDGNLSSPFFGKSTTLSSTGRGVLGNRFLDLQLRYTF